jgi:hypothetical protein
MSGVLEIGKEILKSPVGILSKPKTPTVISTPPPEGVDKEKEKKKIKRKKVTGPTVLTSPLGLTGAAPTKKPTLLGE